MGKVQRTHQKSSANRMDKVPHAYQNVLSKKNLSKPKPTDGHGL
jgi:hypothetical protein